MGTTLQEYRLDEEAYRGSRFADHGHDLKGNNDLLSLSQPDIIREVHRKFLQAGADILETNTFNATSVSQADYATENLAYEINYQSALLAKESVLEFLEKDPSRPRFVAGALGPTQQNHINFSRCK